MPSPASTNPWRTQRSYGRGPLPRPGPSPTGPVYRPRRPTTTPLYPVVQHHLETFLSLAEAEDPTGWSLPSWVEHAFRSYLRWGVLAHGFARVRCTDCGRERLVVFSCKGRGVCPSCNTRRMADVAAHLTDRVLPWLPVRQWVLSIQKRLRPYCTTTRRPRAASSTSSCERSSPPYASRVRGLPLRCKTSGSGRARSSTASASP